MSDTPAYLLTDQLDDLTAEQHGEMIRNLVHHARLQHPDPRHQMAVLTMAALMVGMEVHGAGGAAEKMGELVGNGMATIAEFSGVGQVRQ